MKRNVASTIALIVSLGLAGATMAQGRHDERPHGYDKTKAAATTNHTVPTHRWRNSGSAQRRSRAMAERTPTASYPLVFVGVSTSGGVKAGLQLLVLPLAGIPGTTL